METVNVTTVKETVTTVKDLNIGDWFRSKDYDYIVGTVRIGMKCNSVDFIQIDGPNPGYKFPFDLGQRIVRVRTNQSPLELVDDE